MGIFFVKNMGLESHQIYTQIRIYLTVSNIKIYSVYILFNFI